VDRKKHCGCCVNGKQIEIDPYDDRVVPRIISGCLHCPLLFMAKHMEAKDIKIDPVEKTIEMDFNCPEKYVEPNVFYDRVVEMVVGNNIIKVDGIEYDVGASTRIIDGKTHIPTEQVLKAFGFLTKWENENELHFSRWNYEDKEKKVVHAGTITVGEKSYTVDGETYEMDNPAVVIESNLFTATAVISHFGTKLEWNGATKTIIFTMPVPEDSIVDLINPNIVTRTAQMWMVSLESNEDKSGLILVDGKEYVASGNITIINGRTFAPVKTVALAFGADVSWDENEEQMVIEMSRIDADNAIASIRVVVQAGGKRIHC
jgi:Copper amine oxidase N-terminal domain